MTWLVGQSFGNHSGRFHAPDNVIMLIVAFVHNDRALQYFFQIEPGFAGSTKQSSAAGDSGPNGFKRKCGEFLRHRPMALRALRVVANDIVNAAAEPEPDDIFPTRPQIMPDTAWFFPRLWGPAAQIFRRG